MAPLTAQYGLQTPSRAGSPQHIVLVGAGHAHVEVLRSFGLRPPPDVRLTLISNSANAVYSGMLPGFVAGHFAAEEIQIPIEPLARFSDCTLIMGEATALDLNRRSIRLKDGREICGDIVSLDVGAMTSLTGDISHQEKVIAVKPIESFAREWVALRSRIETDAAARIAVIGAGAAGIELALSLQHRLTRDWIGSDANADGGVTLVVDRAGLVPKFPAGVRRRLARKLRERRVAVILDSEFRAATMTMPLTPRYSAVIGAAGVVPAPWLAASGLALDHGGFVAVDARLRSISHSYVFAVGDAAGMVESPRPKAGVIAVRQGPVLAENLRRSLRGSALRSFIPQRAWLSLISTGDRYAVATRGEFSVGGRWVWYWKRFIDRRFIRRFTILPQKGQSVGRREEADAGGCE